MEEDIKILEKIIKEYRTFGDLDNPEFEDTEKIYDSIEHLIKAYKELEEEFKKEKELNKIIKNTKIDELFTTPRRNGKTIELAMKLREEILKLPECKLYGIKNCKNKCVLLTKDEVITKAKVKEIVDECIPVGKNIITEKEEYQPNANANSYLTQMILELLKDGGE